MLGRWLVGSLAGAMFVGSTLLGAQVPRPLVPLPQEGLRVSPFFDGWYANPDGTVTLSFGYSNLNKDQVVEILHGPDNFIVPKEYDGLQPTSFPPFTPDESPDGGGASGRRDHRERGVFTVTVPAGFKGDVVWTLRNRGQTFSVPGRSKSSAYQLAWPMAMGSIPPALRFRRDGAAALGPRGIHADPIQAKVDTPVPLTIWLKDDSVREKPAVSVKPRKGEAIASMNATWYKHIGPGPIVFSPPKEPITNPEGKSTTSATFKVPGQYVIRVRGDNFGELDSLAADQCCWTNGYVKVTVTR
jgi:hypothetical protein